MASEAGKGSKRRPTNEHAFGNNYDNIFGNKHVLHSIPSVSHFSVSDAPPEPADPHAEMPDNIESA